jgi:hypothetical protein
MLLDSSIFKYNYKIRELSSGTERHTAIQFLLKCVICQREKESNGLYTERHIFFDFKVTFTLEYIELKPSHCTPRRHLGEGRYTSCTFLTSALDGGEWSASRPSRALALGCLRNTPSSYRVWWQSETLFETKRGDDKHDINCLVRLVSFQNLVW